MSCVRVETLVTMLQVSVTAMLVGFGIAGFAYQRIMKRREKSQP